MVLLMVLVSLPVVVRNLSLWLVWRRVKRRPRNEVLLSLKCELEVFFFIVNTPWLLTNEQGLFPILLMPHS